MSNIVFTGTLPNWIVIDGDKLIGLPGVIGGATQDEANQNAQNALNTFMATNLANGSLTCSAACCVDWTSLLWTINKINSFPDTGSIDATFTPLQGDTGGTFVFQADFIASTGEVYIGDDAHGDVNVATTSYNNLGCAGNLHVVIEQMDAGISYFPGDNKLYVFDDLNELLVVDLSLLTVGTYDFPFTVLDSMGVPRGIHVEASIDLVTSTDITGTYKITVTYQCAS